MPSADSTVLYGALPAKLRLTPEEKRSLKAFAQRLADDVAGSRAFTCLITDDRELQRLNHTFLGHDYPTDVLSFPSANGNGELGELAISIERAEAQAREFGHTRIEEVRVLMLHGLLHLTGMDHERDRGAMARAERKWRDVFGLPATLIARSSHQSVGSK